LAEAVITVDPVCSPPGRYCILLRSPDDQKPDFQLTGPLPKGDAVGLAAGYRRWLAEVVDAARAQSGAG
jgi:hypothetical protein